MRSSSVLVVPIAIGLALAACGGGTPVTPTDTPPGTLTVTVFAGAPVQGATVTVYAVDADTAQPLSNRPDRGVLGTSAPTDEEGMASVKLQGTFSGLVQLVATGGSYPDPTTSAAVQALPATLRMTTLVAGYKHGTDLARPITLWTTLADAEALAYAAGRNPYSPSTQTIANAMAVTDVLFARHLDPNASWSIRTVTPVSFAGPQSLRDAVYAGLGDLALNALARRIGNGATAGTLAGSLVSDLTAEGQFDGLDSTSTRLTAGAYVFGTESTRGELAHALDDDVQSAANLSGITRATLQAAGVYDAIASDASLLYPSAVPPPPFTIEGPPGAVTAVIWAGGPVRGATLQVYAIDPATGEPDMSRDDAGLLGTSAAPSDDSGQVTVQLEAPFTGVLQLVALAGSYVDPTDEKTVIALPTNFRMTSYAPAYQNGAHLTAPVTLWTTVADAAAKAYALGRNPSSTTPVALEQALATTDAMLAHHVDKSNAWALRSVRPGSLVQPLVPTAFAALPDLALNQLARTVAFRTQTEVGAAVSAPSLAALLVADLASDGQLDGRSSGGSQLAVPGSPAYALTSEATRGELARALDSYVQNPVNTSGVDRADLQTASVYDSMAYDVCALYPASSPPPTFTLAQTPPSLALVSAPTWTNLAKASVVVTASDHSGSGVKAVYASVASGPAVTAVLDAGNYAFKDIALPSSGTLPIAIWGVDNLDNSGKGEAPPYQLVIHIGYDPTPPTITLVETASYFSEEGMTLASAAIPPEYQLASSSKLSVRADTPIKKCPTRASYGAALPSAADLLANPNNTPYLVLNLTQSASDSPVATPTYTITTDAVGASSPPEQPPPGALVAGAVTGTIQTYYLPLSRETLFPKGTNGATAVQFTVKIDAADEAGNAGSVTLPASGKYTYQLTAVPVFIELDAGFYVNFATLDNPWTYSLQAGNYLDLWDQQPKRLARFILSNPTSEPIRVKLGAPTTPTPTTLYEAWSVEDKNLHIDLLLSRFPCPFLGSPCSPYPIAQVPCTKVGPGYTTLYPDFSFNLGGDSSKTGTCDTAMVGHGDPNCTTMCSKPTWDSYPSPSPALYAFDVDATKEAVSLGTDVPIPAAKAGIPGRLTLYAEITLPRLPSEHALPAAVTTATSTIRNESNWLAGDLIYANGDVVTWTYDYWHYSYACPGGAGCSCPNADVSCSPQVLYQHRRFFDRLTDATLEFAFQVPMSTATDATPLPLPPLDLADFPDAQDFHPFK